MGFDHNFLIKPSELKLRFRHKCPSSIFAFKNNSWSYNEWKEKCRKKLAELLNVKIPEPCAVREIRQIFYEGVVIKALIMEIDEHLSIPAYLLMPQNNIKSGSVVMAIHGHGDVESCIGVYDDPHHMFGLKLAQAGHIVLCPEIRGFGVLKDVAVQLDNYNLDYWSKEKGRQFTLVTDAFLKGYTLMGENIEDLLRWEEWLSKEFKTDKIKVAGLSYGGDLALTYPVFSERVDRIFASGTLGSFSIIYEKCYNAPAHCIPNVLKWMDRSDIAGLNAPRPILIHYGELDVPSKYNYSASFNETAIQSVEELKSIYKAAGCEDNVKLTITPGRGHEMDIESLMDFMD